MVSRSPGISMAQSCAQAGAWVTENYEIHQDGVVAKSVIYKRYEDYCREQGRPVMETSIFGRVVKQVFRDDITIRRLGGRDNLKYYYCGIQAQPNSPYFSDNSNTTRPKRKQRKRDFVADKVEASHCLRWLHSHFVEDNEGTIAKCDLYNQYTQDCNCWTNEPLSQQQFTSVVVNAFTRISKRKVGPKSPQQNVFVGISQRTIPVDPSTIPNEDIISMFESFSATNKLDSYREGSNTPEDDEDYSCRSPESEEGSDMSAGNSENSSSDLKCDQDQLGYPYYVDDMVKHEPVDYSMSSLRLKDEPLDTSMAVVVKEEKMNDQSMGCYGNATPEGPPSHLMDSPTPSPSPPQKSTKTRLYKPRFHYRSGVLEDGADIKQEEPDTQCLMEISQSHCDYNLKQWLLQCLEKCEGVCVNRDQVYSLYEKYCNMTNTEALPLAHFDKVVLQTYPRTVTRMLSRGITFYEGVHVLLNSDIYGLVEVLVYRENSEASQTWENVQQNSLEMSSPPRHISSPITLDDDDDEELDDEYSIDAYRETPDDDLHSIPEVLRDGKYYLKNWLMENFECVPEACVLKADAYKYYEMYIKSVMQTPFEMNVFGKIVRQAFPSVTIRRLGGRQKPQYHYCGISPKPASQLYSLMSGKDPAQRSRKKEISTDNHVAQLVSNWLKSTYEPGRDRILMKTEVLNNYNKYCSSIGQNAITNNYFGKLVKHCFPNVEVKKFGGRTDPNWYYLGLSPRDPSLSQHTMPIDELSEVGMNEHTSPQSTRHYTHHHMNPSNPISVPGGGAAALDSPYSGSPQVIVSLSQQQFIQSHLMRQQPSPYANATSMDASSAHTPESYPKSPGLSRAFRDGLMPHGTLDGGRMMVRSPVEPDVAPENIFPRSPEDTSAQTCRSPATLHSEAVHHMNTAYLPQGLLSSSPNSKRGAQVVPCQTPPSYYGSSAIAHYPVHEADATSMYGIKRVKHQESHLDYNNVFTRRS